MKRKKTKDKTLNGLKIKHQMGCLYAKSFQCKNTGSMKLHRNFTGKHKTPIVYLMT